MNRISLLPILITISVISLVITSMIACTSTNNASKLTSFAIENYQPIPYAKLADFNTTLEILGKSTTSLPIKVAVFHQRGVNAAQSKRLLVTSLNKKISIKNSVLLPPTRFVRPHITLIYNNPQPIMRISLLIGDEDATSASNAPPMKLIDYEYVFINKTWVLRQYSRTTHHTYGQEPNKTYINHEEHIDLTKNERTVKRQNQITKTPFLHTTAILLADSLGYRIVIDTNKEGSNIVLEKPEGW